MDLPPSQQSISGCLQSLMDDIICIRFPMFVLECEEVDSLRQYVMGTRLEHTTINLSRGIGFETNLFSIFSVIGRALC